MADHHDHSDYVHGEMDIEEHKSTYELFNNMAKWGSLIIAVILIFTVILTCTKLGLMTAAIAAIVVAFLGWMMLKKKADPAH